MRVQDRTILYKRQGQVTILMTTLKPLKAFSLSVSVYLVSNDSILTDYSVPCITGHAPGTNHKAFLSNTFKYIRNDNKVEILKKKLIYYNKDKTTFSLCIFCCTTLGF